MPCLYTNLLQALTTGNYMDLLTQSLLGSAVAVSGARKSETGKAAFIGAGSGLLADADVLINSSADPLLFLEYHLFVLRLLLLLYQ